LRWSGPAAHPVAHSLNPDRSDLMLALAVILLIVWALGFLVFKVAAFFIHVLIILAVIAFVMHFVRKGKRTTV
jgi:hypothetical protein